jgi:hypothetical protein
MEELGLEFSNRKYEFVLPELYWIVYIICLLFVLVIFCMYFKKSGTSNRMMREYII